MGAIASKAQFDRVMSFIEFAKLQVLEPIAVVRHPICGAGQGDRADGFAVTGTGSRARRFLGRYSACSNGSDEADMLLEVNQVEYGLTASIWTNDLNTAHRTAMAV